MYPAGGGTGLELGTVQNASLELKVEMKELRGPWRFPVAVADGKGTCSGKVSFAQIWPETIAAITAGTQSKGSYSGTWPDGTGGLTATIAESGTVGGTGNTYVLANGGTGTGGNGFITGSELVTIIIAGYGPVYYTRVSSSPASASADDPTGGSYTIASTATSTTLTFASGDSGNTVKVTYFWSNQGASADQQVGVQLAQVGLNTALTFSLMLVGTGRNIYNNATQDFVVQLNACLAPSLKFDFKLDDWTMLDVDFDAYIDENGNLATFFMLGP